MRIPDLLSRQNIHRQLLTRGQWLKVLSVHRRREWIRQPHRERREGDRYNILCQATLTLDPEGQGKPTVYSKCPVLDASGSGLKLRTYRGIPIGTMLSLELCVADLRFHLMGRVVHSSGVPGSVRIGVKLAFAPAERQPSDSTLLVTAG